MGFNQSSTNIHVRSISEPSIDEGLSEYWTHVYCAKHNTHEHINLNRHTHGCAHSFEETFPVSSTMALCSNIFFGWQKFRSRAATLVQARACHKPQRGLTMVLTYHPPRDCWQLDSNLGVTSKVFKYIRIYYSRKKIMATAEQESNIVN